MSAESIGTGRKSTRIGEQATTGLMKDRGIGVEIEMVAAQAAHLLDDVARTSVHHVRRQVQLPDTWCEGPVFAGKCVMRGARPRACTNISAYENPYSR